MLTLCRKLKVRLFFIFFFTRNLEILRQTRCSAVGRDLRAPPSRAACRGLRILGDLGNQSPPSRPRRRGTSAAGSQGDASPPQRDQTLHQKAGERAAGQQGQAEHRVGDARVPTSGLAGRWESHDHHCRLQDGRHGMQLGGLVYFAPFAH